MSTLQPSHRQLVGAVLLGLVCGVGSVTWLAGRERLAFSAPAGVQASVVTLSAAADMVSVVQASGGDVQAAVESFADGHDDIVRLRVVDLRQRQLLATTDASELADGPLPRPFPTRSEAYRAWSLLGGRLGSAVESNRRTGRLAQEEISVRRLEDGSLSLAAPMEWGRNVHGVVLLDARGRPVDVGGGWLVAVLAVLAALIPVVVLGGRLQGRGWRSVLVVSTVVALTLGGYSAFTLDGLAPARQRAEEKVASRLLEDLRRTKSLGDVAEADIAEALRPDRWDADRFRRPRGVVAGDGSVNLAEIEGSFAEARQRLRRHFLWLSVLGLGLSALASSVRFHAKLVP